MSSSGKYGPPPAFKHFKDDARRSWVVTLRNAVAPILDNNILTHFTDHSVFHSDNLVNIVSELIEPLQAGGYGLNDQELTILYSACYLHDIGMHNERAGDTTVMQKAIADHIGMRNERAGDTTVMQKAIADHEYGQEWKDLQPQMQAELIRKYHHCVAAEMIERSVRTDEPMVGIQLILECDPGRTAEICKAHCTEFGSEGYNELTKDGPEIRMSLLAGLLRVADILDETRPRAERAKARVLNLGLESKVHWWRHYYTEGVTFEEGKIKLWFDFPPDRLDEYSKIIPEMQKPLIEVEL